MKMIDEIAEPYMFLFLIICWQNKHPKGNHPSKFQIIVVDILEELGNKQSNPHTHRQSEKNCNFRVLRDILKKV